MAQASSNVSSSTQKRHQCKVCNKQFTRANSLQTHIYSHTGEKPFACDFEGCGRRFSRNDSYQRHYKTHKRDAHFGAGDHSQNHPTKLSEIPSSPTSIIPPGATSNSMFTPDIQTSPARRIPEPNPRIPFAIPLHPTPKTYHSQAYSVGQLDPETTAMSSDSPVLQHPPSRPSMPSELANDGNTLGKDEGVEDGR
ncbi:hypothetical protein BHE90_005741 [Fusarium euwallaceae]|uniref:C2H2 type master regulator of conidiophore development brlA n=1 Tax=Fusarium euwallaceae TaxID=1147111 RepID=A0A430LVK9_9HYPO|nr:hypothetical protein BHE90_005741 [Fusarium euwallaceae]